MFSHILMFTLKVLIPQSVKNPLIRATHFSTKTPELPLFLMEARKRQEL
jgi:hypothetical protein